MKNVNLCIKEKIEQVRSVDELYVQQENPAKEQGRSR